MKKSTITKLFILLTTIFMLSSSLTGVDAAAIQNQTAQEDVQNTIDNAFNYLETQINQDGGVRWMDDISSVPTTIRTVLALAANHFPQDYLSASSEQLPIDFLSNSGGAWVNQRESESPSFNIARAGQLLTAIAAANENPRHFGKDSVDYINEINNRYDSTTGIYGTATEENVTDQVWAILGLAANHASIPADTANWLARAQNDDGSWNDGFGGFLDITPLAIMALIASDHTSADSPEIQNAIDFLENNQQNNGGWQTQWDSTTNANTTGMILQAIAAIGKNPENEEWEKDDENPITALSALQKEDGMIGGEYANAYSTTEALLGLSGEPLYSLGYLTRSHQAFTYIIESQSSDGGWESVGQTIDAILALRAAGWDPNSITKNENSPLDYIAENLNTFIENGPDALGKLILGLVASEKNPASFAGKNLTEMLIGTYDLESTAFGSPDNTWHQALAILGLASAGEEIPEGAVNTLISLQAENGGWEYATGTGIWPDNTALAIQALISAGMQSDHPVIQNGLKFIAQMQSEDGGWGDSSTTASVLMALNALSLSNSEWKTEIGHNPLSSLLSYQKLNGAFVYSWDYPDDNLMATTASLLAIFDGHYLLSPPETTAYAALIIDPNDQGDIINTCIPLAEDSISGMTLLDASGLSVDTEGGFVNAIGGFKNPKNGTLYWSYWHWDGREWQFYDTGADQTDVFPGSIQAWYLTSWEEFPSKPPAYEANLSDICGTEVLINYKTQPYLNYGDLSNSQEDNSIQQETEDLPISNEVTPSEKDVIKTSTPVSDQTPEETQPQEEVREKNNLLPLLAISILGIGLAIFVYFKLIRKPS